MLYNLFYIIVFQLIIIYFFNYFAKKINLLDIPDSRKRHIGNIPLTGGLVIYFSIIFLFFLIEIPYLVKIIFVVSTLLLIIGLVDDKFKLGVRERFFFQIISVLILIGYNLYIFDLGGILNFLNTDIKQFSIIFTFLCVIAFINSINFIDGVDGLAGGLILNILLSIILFSYLEGFDIYTKNIFIFYLIIIILIFLLANFGIFLPKLFLGDSGSNMLGLNISFLIIYFTQIEKAFDPILAIWLCAFPIFDLSTVFLRRLYKGISPFKPDRRHFHYLIIGLGVKSKLVTILIVTISFIFSIIGYLSYSLFNNYLSIIIFIIFFLIFFFLNIVIGRRLKIDS